MKVKDVSAYAGNELTVKRVKKGQRAKVAVEDVSSSD